MWDWPDPIGVQSQSISWFDPGMTSDLPYGDVTGDSIPEIPVTRIPATTPTELGVAAIKNHNYTHQDFSNGAYLIADQGRSYNGESGAWASAIADTFATKIPSTMTKIRLHDTDALPLTHTQALGQFLTACATNHVVGATFTGTVYNRSKMNWLNLTDGDSWSLLGSGQFLCAIAAPTCELVNGHDRWIDPTYGRGLGSRSFASFPNQGPAWVWSSNCGSHQGANADLGRSFFHYAYETGAWSGAAAVILAVHDAGQNWFTKYQALGTEILGDVTSPFPGMIVRTTGVYDQHRDGFALGTLQTINVGTSHVRWSAPSGYHVQLRLLDVTGRVCLQPSDLVGVGTNLEYRLAVEQLSPGIYFLQLQGGGSSLTKKCILLH